ncbi:c-type cytochrome [Dokdonia sp. Hel_I_53]|uniref:c-type cytochrome n=1 Tax=Dokdonia sp. Hel_I_53 TaxID=1566287 RepID=UPI0011994B48|nr:cytochrome c [Dokdonia sp. Hel_I_53]TVZ52248.1 quinol:cytochrome c oxidoreductase monoheme cytochrome subunit [Dokdonia sp. Hel_I_53]
MKNILKIAVLLVAFSSLISCKDDNKPNYQYMPNMYESVGYEAYGKYEVFPDGYEAMTPAEGSIARGWLPYDYDNTQEGKASAKANLINPLPYTEENFVKGNELYNIYCGICHGEKGDGQGILAKREKILGVPAYNDEGRAITEGSVYHVMYYGINSMGSYASQMTEDELWMVNHYVMSLKAKLDGNPERVFSSEDIIEEMTEGQIDVDLNEGAVDAIPGPESDPVNATGDED